MQDRTLDGEADRLRHLLEVVCRPPHFRVLQAACRGDGLSRAAAADANGGCKPQSVDRILQDLVDLSMLREVGPPNRRAFEATPQAHEVMAGITGEGPLFAPGGWIVGVRQGRAQQEEVLGALTAAGFHVRRSAGDFDFLATLPGSRQREAHELVTDLRAKLRSLHGVVRAALLIPDD